MLAQGDSPDTYHHDYFPKMSVSPVFLELSASTDYLTTVTSQGA
jgi:hypothetical protein